MKDFSIGINSLMEFEVSISILGVNAWIIHVIREKQVAQWPLTGNHVAPIGAHFLVMHELVSIYLHVPQNAHTVTTTCCMGLYMDFTANFLNVQN